ncbi:TonB-dependent receptor [Sphingomonas sp. SUN019]|uniref:TonB-dependent receptor n=1 Tax=Sphingomonas sp. SUN019 TaxID=2937788 RepID=UPI0021646855|nr:TonB-dependent receptor [Sphingomonas sp. SUN019]UVO52061.1 TonB-dependent receptor [Sphingomonas sp. SUN019]
MTKFELLAASAIALIAATPAYAAEPAPAPGQDTAPTNTAPAQTAPVQTGGYGDDVVVTAQRQSQTLQEVPIAVSAFTSAALEAQQIDNASDLQLTLPNITFSKTNFTSSSFTIRGIGDLCVGISCDQATAIHLNGSPLLATRIFETEYFDLERVEVLRGPQGTLFGRSATAGVVNFITAKPRTDKFAVSAEGEYGNYESIRAKAMINLPLGDTLAVRVAGFYLNRDGYTKNLYNDTRLDGRDMYSVRGSIRWEPSIDTTVDLMGSYFKEDDNRLRIQKQLCQTDPTGVLGCLNNRRDAGRTNTNSTFTGTLGSREFLTINLRNPALGQAFGLGSLYGPDAYTGNPILNDPREVFTAYDPTYKTDELTVQGRIDHNFGPIKAQLTGFYHETSVDSSQDYNLGVQNRALVQPALNTLAAAAAGQVPGLPASFFAPIAAAVIPGGPTGQICTSLPEETGLGSYGGFKRCSDVPLAFDRSNQKTKDWSAEAIISSDFDGMFNFLLGGIYVDGKVTNGDYYVNAFAIDYITGLLGSFTALGTRADANPANDLPPGFLATPFFRNATARFGLKSYGIFGETYFDFNDRLKLTLGLRYNNDKKTVQSRSTLASFLTPYGQTGSAFDSPFYGSYDADPVTPGVQDFARRKKTFDEFTGRAVVNFKVTDDNLLYASYSRGYKSGGFNPPVQVPGLTVPDAFVPEIINAFEVGSKNTFDNGRFTLNLTGFYYKYKGLQLSRIVARTSINDNIDADIYGVEAEAFFRPAPDWAINIGASYLHTKVTSEAPFINQRDVSGGDPNTVIIKDITAAFNCVVRANTGGAAVAQGFVTAVNSQLGLRGPQAFPADANIGASTGAFSICDVLRGAAANTAVVPAGLISVLDGIGVSIKGNELPQAPVVKFSAGVQKTFEFGNGMSFVPRFDLTYTGESYGNIFNGRINKVSGYEQANAQVQLNGADERWFLRGFVQNIFDNNATTGLYLTDQSSGLFTNIFTLEPRRYGIAAGVKF